MTTEPPFTLFVLDENIDTKYLDRSLKLTHDWDTNARWDLWVATDSHEDMPKAPGERQPLPQATKPPLKGLFRSPWIGNIVEECAKWLQNAPDESAVQKEYFIRTDTSTLPDEFLRHLPGSILFISFVYLAKQQKLNKTRSYRSNDPRVRTRRSQQHASGHKTVGSLSAAGPSSSRIAIPS
ncbi:uncharacterized protein CC84DRAFT_218565 [Paraphaeosphaeria sporulosa]|uniref:Uncharacterized protein n=1 Tax=Paraphaeosphaeria sporulosa TaxID=1460663 RepID=A0A177C4H8_9PLEO|nr:uncharacterized protein CC84DRAFT_218565 [Paraphaeosphaeria sporulosa]OAG01789.1 hypothetical protein CC84DRAFT_218565 [Paraphaeosphaeria sporulosa]